MERRRRSCRCRFGSEGGGTATWEIPPAPPLLQGYYRLHSYSLSKSSKSTDPCDCVSIFFSGSCRKLYVTTWFENTVWWFEKVDMIKIMFPTQFDHVKIFGIMQDSQADSFVEVLALVRHIGWTVP